MRHVQRGGRPGRPGRSRPGCRSSPRTTTGTASGTATRATTCSSPGSSPDQDGYDSGYNTGQVYGQGGRQRRRPRPATAPGAAPAPNWRRRIKSGAITLVVVLLAVSVGTYFWADSKLKREVDLSKVIERPEGGDGTNYLIVGSDSREGMSDQDKKDLHTGSAAGKRTDSMMILHVADDGGNTMISLPRDSNVTIPSFKGAESGKLYPAPGPADQAQRGVRGGRPRAARRAPSSTTPA